MAHRTTGPTTAGTPKSITNADRWVKTPQFLESAGTVSAVEPGRVVIAAALSIEPRLIVADEPVSMLDVSIRAGILNLLQNLAREDGIGILMITHDLTTVAAYCDRIAVMYLGKIVETGPTIDVIRAPRHPYTEALLSVVPSHDPDHAMNPILLEGETPDAAKVPTGCRFHPRCPKAFEASRWSSPTF